MLSEYTKIQINKRCNRRHVKVDLPTNHCKGVVQHDGKCTEIVHFLQHIHIQSLHVRNDMVTW